MRARDLLKKARLRELLKERREKPQEVLEEEE